MYVDRALVLLGANKELADALEKTSITGENCLDCFLAARGKMHEFFVEKEGISFALPLPPPFI